MIVWTDGELILAAETSRYGGTCSVRRLPDQLIATSTDSPRSRPSSTLL